MTVKNLSLKAHAGVTLIELLLVLSLGMVFILMGLRAYQQLSQQRDVAVLQANVDTIFQGMARYYQKNCRDKSDINDVPIPKSGTLSPASIPGGYPPSKPFVFPLTDLMIPDFKLCGYNPCPGNQLVNQTDGYRVQFNPATTTSTTSTRTVTTQYASETPTPVASIIKQNTVIIWRAQVAVRINDVANIDMYRGLLNATCVSSFDGTMVTPCNSQPSKGDYLVWERLPSFASPSTSTALWPSMLKGKQFNQQYTNDDFYAFNYDDAQWNNTMSYETYLCGG